MAAFHQDRNSITFNSRFVIITINVTLFARGPPESAKDKDKKTKKLDSARRLYVRRQHLSTI